jgi:hypothetical protein
MPQILDQIIGFAPGGLVRVFVQVQTHRDQYHHLIQYSHHDVATPRLDQDVAALMTSAQLCADIQDELDNARHHDSLVHGDFAMAPLDRTSFVRPVSILGEGHPHHTTGHQIRLRLSNSLTDTVDADFNAMLQTDGEHITHLCPSGCLYTSASPADVQYFVGRLRKASLDKAIEKANKKLLFQKGGKSKSRPPRVKVRLPLGRSRQPLLLILTVTGLINAPSPNPNYRNRRPT